jgi:ketosteroid isomerase-like protein
MIPIDNPDVIQQVTQAVQAYETALMSNDVTALDGFFWNAPQTVRYGVAENLYGFEEIAAFRLIRAGGSPPRTVVRMQIVALGADVALAHVEFVRSDTGKNGRQSQTWLKTLEGWKIATAHVSLRQDGADQRNSS